MYQSHWGLQESPFLGCVAPEFFYPSPTHEEALARLQFLVDQRRRLGVLLGPSGSGKSLLLDVFAQQLRQRGRPVARLSLLGSDADEFLWQLATAWGLNPAFATPVGAIWRLLNDRLSEFRYQQLETVALFDDVDQADAAVLTHVARLARCHTVSDLRLTLVLAGRPEGIRKLDAHLLDLVELRIDVEPWEQADTQQFLTSSLARAGRKSPLFAEPAVAKLHELAHGIPRRVSQLADLALLAGAGQNLQRIDAGVVESAYQELGGVASL
jgi:general secretion pathway protein A